MRYDKPHNRLILGLKQSGSAACVRAARRAAKVARESKQGADESQVHVKVGGCLPAAGRREVPPRRGVLSGGHKSTAFAGEVLSSRPPVSEEIRAY